MAPSLDQISNLLDSGASHEAVRLIRASWEPDLPTDIRAPLYGLWVRGLCESGDLERSKQLALRSVEEFPKDPDAWTALGNVCDARAEAEESLEAFRRAVELSPRSQLSHYNVGALLERLGREAEAEQHFQLALQGEEGHAPLPEAAAALGALLRRYGRIEEAEEVYDEYLQDDPLDVELLVEHGICLSDLESHEDAIERFEQALAIDPHYASAYYNLGITYYRAGRFDDAIDVMSKAYEQEPQNSLTQAVLGGWILSDKARDADWGLQLVYRAQEAVFRQFDAGLLHESFACLVMEEIFEALWNSGRSSAAREVARAAGRRDWITPHMLNTINREDHGPHAGSQLFVVTARAEIAHDVPSTDFPNDANGYTTDLTVAADDEDEARELTMKYLREIDPGAKLELEIRAHPPSKNPPDGLAQTRGVMRVLGRSFFSKDAAGHS